MWEVLGVVALAGAFGGMCNALITDNGFVMPRSASVDGNRVIRPGVLGNILTGLVAASISWGLYGPLATEAIIKRPRTVVQTGTDAPEPKSVTLTLFSLAGAVLVGIGGARWLTSEVDKSLLKNAAAKLAAATPDGAKAARIALASPAQVAEIAESM